MNLRMLAMTGATLLALAGCTDARTSARPSASPIATGPTDSRAAWLDVAKCMRTNGFPAFPDPAQDSAGVWDVSYPLTGPEPAACDPLVRKAKQASNALRAPSTAEIAKLRRYADCVRSHGAPTFPDPNSEGNFDLPQQLRDDPSLQTARDACRQYAPPARPK